MPEVAAGQTATRYSTRLQTLARPFRLPRTLMLALVVGCAYCAGTRLGLLLTPPDRPISTLWPPNALLFAALLLTPVRTWPMLLAVVLPAHLFVQLRSGIPPLTAAGWYVTNVGEALLGAVCLRRFSVGHRMAAHTLFESFRGVIFFVLLGVVLAPVVTSFLDITVVIGTGWGAHFWRLWLDRCLSNMLANLTLIPPIVVIASKWRSIRTGARGYVEASMILAAVVLIVGIVFGAEGANYSVVQLIYLLLPVLLWAAVRLGSAGVSVSLLLVALFSIWNAMHGRGPFGPHASDVLSLQIFLCAIDVPLLCLAAVLDERRAVEQQLRQHERLADLVSQLAAGFISIDWRTIDDQINLSLMRLRGFLDADLVTLFQRAGEELQLRYAAFREYSHAGPPNKMAISELQWVVEKTYQRNGTLINDLHGVPTDAVKRKTLADFGVTSIAIVPLGKEGWLAGTLCVASMKEKRDWPPNLLPQLQILAKLLTSAMQRKYAFQALTESEQRFRHTTDHSPMLVWMSGADGLCTYFNRAWLEFTGVELQKQLGDGWTHLVHPKDVAERLSIYTRAFTARHEFKMEYRLRRHDGEYRWMLDIGVPRFDSERTFLGYIGSAVDVTERKHQEAAISLSAKLIKAQEEERQRIARELHDDVGQRLALLTIDLDRLHKAPDSSLQHSMLRLLSEAHSISDCIRNISHDLHSPAVDMLPLGTNLRRLCRDFTQRASIEVHFEERDVPPDLLREVKVCLYRVVQEALRNIAKHSRARQAKIELTGDREGLTLKVVDDGVGFEVEQQSAAAGMGLASMRERVASATGTITITSAPMRGTQITAHIPLEAATDGLAETA
jgi:PAS domain S-box-containing protein